MNIPDRGKIPRPAGGLSLALKLVLLLQKVENLLMLLIRTMEKNNLHTLGKTYPLPVFLRNTLPCFHSDFCDYLLARSKY